MCTGRRLLGTLLLVSLVGGALVWRSGAGTRSVEASEKQGSRLLVKCSAEQVEDVIARLRGLDVKVWDLETMRPLPLVAPTPTPLTPAEIPRLRDAEKLMEDILSTVGALGTEPSGAPITIVGMVIQERRATFKVVFREIATSDRIRRAVQQSSWFKANGTQLQTGALQRLVGGGMRTSFTVMRSGAGAGSILPSSAGLDISTTDVQRASHKLRMQMMYASPTQDTPNRKMGYRTASREFTYDAATLPRFRKLVHELSILPSKLTVYELRWKLLDQKARVDQPDAIGKSVLKVGVRTPLASK